MQHLSSFITGYSLAWEWLLRRGGGWNVLRLPARCFLLEHERHGRTLFDTGYGPHFHEVTRRWPARFLAKLIPCQILASAADLVGRVDRIVLSHFHPDHVGSLRDFSDVPILCTEEAYRRRGGLLQGCLDGLLPADFLSRVQFIRDPDLFGDGSLVAVPLPGHAHGQIGLRSGNVCLCADAYYLKDESPHWLVRRTFADATAWRRTRADLLAQSLRLLACHDPEQPECERLWTSTP